MSYTPHVDYREFYSNGTKKKFDYICFSEMNSTFDKGISRVNYLARVSKTLTKEEINYYCKFLKQLLKGSKAKFRSFIFKKKNRVYCSVNTKKMSLKQIWLPLTLARYVDDFPEIVKKFYNPKLKGAEEQFKWFQEVHIHFMQHSGGLQYNNLCGHAAIFSYNYANLKIITLENLHINIKSKDINTVQGFFVAAKVEKPKIAPAPIEVPKNNYKEVVAKLEEIVEDKVDNFDDIW